MVRKCRGTATMDAYAAANVRFRARSTAGSSTGPTKRRRTSEGESFGMSSNNPTWSQAQLRSSAAGIRISVVPPREPTSLGEEFRCLSSDDQVSVSCCSSSYGSSEMEKKKPRFVDLEESEPKQEEEAESGEADSSSTSSSFSVERREMNLMKKKKKTPSSESSGTDSSEEKPLGSNPPERFKEEIQSSVVDEDEKPEEMFSTDDDEARKLEIKMPSQFEIEEFFASAEASNLREVEHYKKKYNFDFVKEEALEGRFEWREVPASVSVSAPRHQIDQIYMKTRDK